MTQELKYKLNFYKKELAGKTYNICGKIGKPTEFSILQFIDRLSIFETKSFIEELEFCMESESNGNTGFFSDSVDDMKIKYIYPSVEIDGILIIPMFELKKLLEEWLIFIEP